MAFIGENILNAFESNKGKEETLLWKEEERRLKKKKKRSEILFHNEILSNKKE